MTSSKKSQSRSAMLFVTHRKHPDYLQRFFKLKKEAGSLCDIYYGYDADAHGRLPLPLLLQKKRVRKFDREALVSSLGYPFWDDGGTGFTANSYFPLIELALETDYAYYYQVEYDVCYNGNWTDLISQLECCANDFTGGYISAYQERTAAWPWWNSLEHPKLQIALTDRYRSFNPFCRFSREALLFLHQAHLSGWRGYCEVLIPTLLNRGGLRVASLHEVLRGRVPGNFLSSFRPVPEISAQEFENSCEGQLLHPVK